MRWLSKGTLSIIIVASLAAGARAQDNICLEDDGLTLPAIRTDSSVTDDSSKSPASPASDPNDAYGPHPAGTMLAPVRQKIVAIALGEVGKVSDLGGENGFKKGWPRL